MTRNQEVEMQDAEWDLSEVPEEVLAGEIIKRYQNACVFAYREIDENNSQSFIRTSGHRYGVLGLIEYAKSSLIREMQDEGKSEAIKGIFAHLAQEMGCVEEEAP